MSYQTFCVKTVKKGKVINYIYLLIFNPSTLWRDIDNELTINNDSNEVHNKIKFVCKFCNSGENGIKHYNAALICSENSFSNKLIILNLSTYDQQGVF